MAAKKLYVRVLFIGYMAFSGVTMYLLRCQDVAVTQPSAEREALDGQPIGRAYAPNVVRLASNGR